MKIIIGSDHGGFSLKKKIIDHIKKQNLDFFDAGCYSTESVDYPEYGKKVAVAVSDQQYDRGIVVCGTGIGISIAANKVKGIRCALVHDITSAKLTREHNDSNVLAMGGRIVDHDTALEIVDIWLKTEFAGGRHLRRIQAIEN